MRVAWFTPLPPMPSGIADYSTEIIPYVAERAEVEVFCPRPGMFRSARVPRGAVLRDPRRYDELLDGYDAAFYHLGNNPYHEFVYKTAKDRPGIAVFHDADLHHLIAYATFESRRDFTGYEEILREELGDLGGRVATLRRIGLATEFEKFVFPLTAHVATRAKGIIVHSEDSRAKMQDIAPDVPIAVVPHHAGEPPEAVRDVTREEARRRLGIPQDAFVVGHLGFITKPKQPAAVVGGFARVYREFPSSLLYMVGADRTGGALSKLVADLGVGPAVRLAGYVDLTQFYLHLKALDAMINLRYPSAGESSGTFARALAEGRAAIVNNYGSFAEVPGDVALKVEIDSPQAEQVGEHLLHLARDPGYRRDLEERARGYARRVLDPNRCRDLYLEFARSVGRPERGTDDRALAAPRARPITLSEAVTHRHRVEDLIESATATTLGPRGSATFIELVTRLVLRRAPTGDEIRDAHVALVTGSLTRNELAARILQSEEFAEIGLIDRLLVEAAASAGPFRIDSPIGPGASDRVAVIPWVIARSRGVARAVDVTPEPDGAWIAALAGLRIPSLHLAAHTGTRLDDVRELQADPTRLPYRDGSFDVAYCLRGAGDPGVLDELLRVVSVSGRVLVASADVAWLDHALASDSARVVERTTFHRTPQGWSADARDGDLAVVCASVERAG